MAAPSRRGRNGEGRRWWSGAESSAPGVRERKDVPRSDWLTAEYSLNMRSAAVATPPRTRRRGQGIWGLSVKLFQRVAGCIGISVVVAAGGVARADDFPLTGSYTQNVPCKGDGSDPADFKVKISPQEINSGVGVCIFLDTKREGSSIKAQVECQFAAGPLMGDITFTIRPDKTIEFIDRDKTYSAVLYRCPE